MKIVLIILLLAICSISEAQDTINITTQKDTSTFYLIRLTDNTALSGKILERNSNEIIFYDITIGKVTIPMTKIDKMTALSGNQYCILTTHDGKSFTGLIIMQNDTEITLKTESLGVITISNAKIRDIKMAQKEQIVRGKYLFPNPHPTRYLFGPSAIPLEKGEGYYQNTYLISNSFQFGLTDHFSMGGGILIPVLFYITPKFGYQVSKNIYLGGGIMAATSFSSGFSVGLGVAYGSLTLGNKENNFTIDAGYGFIKQENYNSQTGNSDYEWAFADKPMFSFSGSLRLAPKLALVTENWVFATKEYKYNYSSSSSNYYYKYRSILSFGFRIMGEQNSFDIAIAVPSIEGEVFGFPYIDYVFKF